ncbi:zinc finger protein 26-like [Anopheles maculipalpis]|uniref:zinc finger protein 26-like n=1 Tax=Anopheles maculipalpis TaxID=1496333 RepID=UPI0021595CF4|nr:zinc finger protein 26-like [Anopheles maculipalpis]
MDIARKSAPSTATTTATESRAALIDFKKICRICGKTDETLTSVHSRYQNDLRGKIAKYLNVDIEENGTLPTKICFCCKDIITKWHDLFEKCRVMEERFESILKSCEEQRQTELLTNGTHDEPTDTNNHSAKEGVEPGGDGLESVASIAPQQSAALQHDQESKKSQKSSSKGRTITCTFCRTNGGTANGNTRFDSQTALVDHLKDQHWEQIFHCEQCDNYLDRDILIEHMTMHALSLLQPMSVTEGTEQEPESMASGSGVGEEEPEGELEEAEGSQQTTEIKSGEGSTNKENDEKDLPAAAPEAIKTVEGRKLYCYICEKTLGNRSAYSYHVNQVHLNIKKFDCTFCEKKFGNRRLLNNHIANLHSRERNFGCTVCDKRFKTNVALYNHMRVHDDKLQFSCRFCDKKFRFRNHLVSHELVHLDERNYSCSQCDKKFNTNECLQKHKLTHVTTEPYQCPLCGFSTKQKRYLVLHAKRIHMVR